MVPNPKGVSSVNVDEDQFPKLKAPQADPWDHELSYCTIVAFSYLHAAGLYGAYLYVTVATWPTVIFSIVLFIFSVLGITAGAHRLWSHHSYKVNTPLQIILMLFHTLSGQYSVYNWVRDHRMHHRYVDTDADPHNSTRGFFFSHMGWLLVQKHPEVKRRGMYIDMSDIENDPVLAFQRRHALVMFTMVCYVIPTLIPLLWGETLHNAYHIDIFRFIVCLNSIALINSAAHAFGSRPYDKAIRPADNKLVVIATLGDGFHNFHHTFSWDYRSAEFGNQKYNLTSKFIEFFARLGWAYDLKTVDEDIITKRASRSGDGSRLRAQGLSHVTKM